MKMKRQKMNKNVIDLKTYNITPEIINYIKNKIVSFIQPEKIILFGSYAVGMANEDSDLDLFIITDKFANTRRDKRALEISDIFRPRFFSIDIIVNTPEEARIQIENENFFIIDILENGKIIYEKKTGSRN